MIPKIIHYCWFGGKPLPDLAVKCIESWKKYCPGYEIKEWNERNFDINSCEYIREAYSRKRWAFISDYARFKILYEFGGLYFDTDVELIREIEDIVLKGPFMGEEIGVKDTLSKKFNIAPGLGLAANPGLGLYKEIIDYYEGIHFIDKDGEEIILDTVVTKITRLLTRHGFIGNGLIEKVSGIFIYPPEYFCPKNFRTGELCLTENTRSIHHYTASWLNTKESKWNNMELWIGKYLGVDFRTKLKRNVLWITISNIYKYGLKRTIMKIKRKLHFG